MATSRMAEEAYNYSYITELLERISDSGADVAACLREAVREDGAEKPLPFELVRAVLDELHGEAARQFLRAALALQIWKESENTWLLFQQFCLQQQQETGHWRQQVMPLVRRIWARAPRGSAFRGGAAYWLAERDAKESHIPLAALIEASPRVTSPGHYVRRLRLWQQRRPEIEAVLPQAVSGLADAWGWLGKERLADRAAVAALLALALRSRSTVAAGRLREEVETLLAIIPDTEGRSDLQAALDALRTLPCCDTALRAPCAEPLPADHRSEALRRVERLKEAELPAEIDHQLWQVILSAEVARRKSSSSAALQILALAEPFVAPAGPEIAWAFHYLRAFLFRSRLEYHAALLAVEETRRLAGETGSRHLLYKTHSLRHRMAHDIRLQEVEVESDAVLDVLDQMSALQGLPLGERKALTLARAFSVEGQAGQEYFAVLRHLEDLRTVWAGHRRYSGYLGEQVLADFSRELASVTQECERVLPSRRDEPLLFAQMRFDLAQLALTARHEWTQNTTLYQATIKPCLDDAFGVAAELEAYTFLRIIQRVVAKHKDSVLRPYEIPRRLASPASARRQDLARISGLLRATSTASERRWLLRVAHKTYAEHLDELDVNSLSSDEVHTFFELLQDLKQPSLEDNIELPVPLTTHAEPTADAFSFDDEEIITDDFSRPPPETWRALVSQRLSREDALCLDFFFTNKQMYCFVIESAHGQLTCRLLSLGVHEKGKLRQVVSLWRGQLRSTAVRLGSHPHSAGPRLEKQLRRNWFLPGPLEDLLSHRHAGTLYVAPFLGLHGFPLHAVRAQSGWCLSDVGPVLCVAKTRQLAAPGSAGSRNIQILTGPDPHASFENVGEKLAERINATRTTPSTRAELLAVFHESKIVVLLGHGWFDPERPTRSRVALDHGLRLTLPDMQTLGLEGTEVVLLSCWAAWGMRGNLPIGELYSGPAAWMVGGAGAVLAPLWPVPIEAASQFLGDYLEARGRGETRANALQRAREQSANYLLGGACHAAYVLWGPDAP